MQDQLFRWVKTSDRVPNIWMRSQSKRIPIRTHGEYYNTGIYRNYNGSEEFEIGIKETVFEKESFHLIEWLEPYTPSLNAGSLEAEAIWKKHQARYESDLKNCTATTNYPKLETYIIDGIKEAAAYVKGGEEKTLGQLIQWRTKENVLSPHISDEVWNDLINDNIWTNCIPIRIFQNLLALLEIPFWLAKDSMNQTYKILWTAKQKEKVTLDTRRDLWENREAFDKYINRLGELISESSRPSLDIDKVVEQLREAIPMYNGFTERGVWNHCCDKLKELLNQKEAK